MKENELSEQIAEKAVLMSGNKDIQEAKNWIEQHKADPDFNEPIEVEMKPELTDEEARAEAIKLQKQIREKALEIEKQRAIEAEKMRVHQAKEMAEAKRKQKSVEKRLAMEMQMKEKKKLEQEMEMMERKLEEDKRQRFGEKYKPQVKEVKGVKDEFEDLYGKMYNIYRMGQIETLKTCLKTIQIYNKNIIQNPDEPKFQRINGNNPNFQNKVGDVIGGGEILKKIGFELESDGFWVLKNKDLQTKKEIQDLLEQKIHVLNGIL